MRKLHALFSLSLFASSSFCLADWHGSIHVAGSGHSESAQGKIYAKGSKLRFEMQSQGHEMIVLSDQQAKTASMLMPAQKMAMEMPANVAEKQMLSCSTTDVDGCFRKKGYKETGKETLDGHPCVIYEGDEAQKQVKLHQRVWRPTDMKEVFMLKSVAKMQDGSEVTTLVKDIKLDKLNDSLFKIPADYKKMPMPDFSSMHH